MTVIWTQALSGAQDQNDFNLNFGQNFESGLSDVIGKTVDACTFDLKKQNSPTMTIQAKIWSDTTTPTVLATSNETIDASTLTSSFVSYRFTFPTGVLMDVDYKIGLSFSAANTTNHVKFSMSTTDVSDTDTERTSDTTGDWEALRSTSFTMSVEAGGSPTSTTLLPPPVAWI